ncbi:MAG TPA: DUF1189 family protein [Patescibacteria group bacterium]|nr:DUF1189 family protein [Patescibacteria group bacterium]
MNFFEKIAASIYSPKFYQHILQDSTKSAIGFFTLFVLVLTIAQTIILFFFHGFINFQGTVKTEVNRLVQSYPDDLIVTITNGIVTTNVQEPYVIPLPNTTMYEAETKTNLIVIDTKTPFSATDFKKYNSYVWLTKDALFIADDTDIRSLDLTEVGNLTINQSLLSSLYKTFSPWLNIITPILTVFMLLGIFIGYFLRLVYLFLLALLIMLLTKLMKKSVSYGQAYRVGIYAMTPAFLFDLLLLFVPSLHFPFLFSIVTLGIVFINFLGMKPAIKKATTTKKKKKA